MAKAQATTDMQACQQAGLAELEKQLADAYNRATASLPADQKAKLQAAEKLWTSFRSADCGVFAGADTGTMSTVQAGSCMIDHAKQRIADLAKIDAK